MNRVANDIPGGNADVHVDHPYNEKAVQTSTSNGHAVESPAKNSSTLKKCIGATLNFFKNPPFAAKIVVGLALLGVAVAVFVALSPKLLVVASVVTGIAAAAGLFVLARATVSKIMEASNNKRIITQYNNTIKKQFIDSLVILISKLQDCDYYDKKNSVEFLIEEIKKLNSNKFFIDPNKLKTEIIDKLLFNSNDQDSRMDNLFMFRRLLPETETNIELHREAIGLFSAHSEEPLDENDQRENYLKAILFDNLTQA